MKRIIGGLALLVLAGAFLYRPPAGSRSPSRRPVPSPARTAAPDAARQTPPQRSMPGWLDGAETVQAREQATEEPGVVQRVRVVRSDFKYPFLRVEQRTRRDAATGAESVLDEAEVVADHLLVRLVPGKGRRDLEAAAGRLGLTLRRAMLSPGMFIVKLPGPDADAMDLAIRALLEERGLVRWVGPDPIHHLSIIPNDPSYPSQWALPQISAPAAWDLVKYTAEVVVGVVDSGVDYLHPDLALMLWENPGEIPGNGIDDDGNGFTDDVMGWNFYDDNNDPMDHYFHGTHCAGIIGAQSHNNVGVTGVSWAVKIAALKAFGPLGGGAESDILDATVYALKIGIPMTSNSYGTNKPSQAFIDVLDDTEAIGMLFVASAGNAGKDSDSSPLYPAAYPHSNIISVAATTPGDTLTGFSNWGKNSVDLGAPGLSILSTMPNGQYALKDGTSMAGPFVAGGAALLKAFVPSLTFSQLKLQILSSVDPVPALAGKCTSGGRLNLYKPLLAFLPGSLQFEYPQHKFGENVGFNSILVTRTGGSWGAVSVDVSSFAGSATPNQDYDALPQTLIWQSGDTTAKKVTFAITDDSWTESYEDFNFLLSNPTGGATLGSPVSSNILIVDDD
jgi:subtilisin family serine protease